MDDRARKQRHYLTGAVVVSVLTALTACTTPFKSDIAPNLPDRYHEPSTQTGKKVLSESELATWWDQFNDPLLSELIARALEQNADLQIALTRVDQARAAERGAFSMLMPNIGYGAQIRRYDGGDTNSILLTQSGVDEARVTYWQSALQASWEIDLFGAGRARLASSREQVAASAADVQAVRLTLVSTVASIYINYRGLQQQQLILAGSLNEAKEFLTIAERLFEMGSTMSTDVDIARTGVAQVQAKLEQSEVTLAQLRLNLEEICMLNPGSLEEKLRENRPLPSIPIIVAPGQPIDLLMRRPDLIAAEARVRASTSQGDAARRDYYPKLTLNGLFGQSGFTVGSGIPGATGLWMGGLGLVLPLFDFGARQAQVELSDARSREAQLALKKSALNALFDVERSMAQLARDEQLRKTIQEQVDSRALVLRKTTFQYELGDVGRLDMAKARAGLLESQSAMVGQQVTQLQAQIALFRAIGGGWNTSTNTQGEVPPEQNTVPTETVAPVGSAAATESEVL